MTSKNFLSRLMKMSWAIQRAKRFNRARSLTAAWVILSNEDVTMLYLMHRLNHGKPLKGKAMQQITLFPQA